MKFCSYRENGGTHLNVECMITLGVDSPRKNILKILCIGHTILWNNIIAKLKKILENLGGEMF